MKFANKTGKFKSICINVCQYCLRQDRRLIIPIQPHYIQDSPLCWGSCSFLRMWKMWTQTTRWTCIRRTWEGGKFMNTQIQVETRIQNKDLYEEISPAFMFFAHREGGKWYFCSDGQGRVLAFLCVLLYNPKYYLSSCLYPSAFEGWESFWDKLCYKLQHDPVIAQPPFHEQLIRIKGSG